jgi:phosphoribosylanthranilate isomerase
MRIMVKICGLRTPEAVAAVVAAGADAAGFVFAESVRRVSPARAAELAAALPDSVARVAVMKHPAPAEVAAMQDGFSPTFLQTEHADFGRIEIRGPCRPLPVLRAGRRLPRRLPPLVLFEGPVSGSGETTDWTRAAKLARRTRLILAGGLDPENVGDAIEVVRPYGVDVSSGVESAPGIKDPALIHRFVAAVRAAEKRAMSLHRPRLTENT